MYYKIITNCLNRLKIIENKLNIKIFIITPLFLLILVFSYYHYK